MHIDRFTNLVLFFKTLPSALWTSSQREENIPYPLGRIRDGI